MASPRHTAVRRWSMGKVSGLAARRGARPTGARRSWHRRHRAAGSRGHGGAGRACRGGADLLLSALWGLLSKGMGTLIIARGDAFGQGVIAGFCSIHSASASGRHVPPVATAKLATYVRLLSAATPMVPIEPSYARKLRDLVLWSGSRVQPAPGFARWNGCSAETSIRKHARTSSNLDGSSSRGRPFGGTALGQSPGGPIERGARAGRFRCLGSVEEAAE